MQVCSVIVRLMNIELYVDEHGWVALCMIFCEERLLFEERAAIVNIARRVRGPHSTSVCGVELQCCQ